MAVTSHAERQEGDRGNLVLWLAVGKSIVVDNGRVVLTCVSSGEQGAKIAFEAARSIPIDRQEVHDDKVRRGKINAQ